MNKNITPKETQSRLDRGALHLIDVRTPVEHAALHVEGATLMPLDTLDPDAVRKHGKTCALLCGSGKRATDALRKLEDAGCKDLLVVEGGITAWDQAGLPVRRNDRLISLERQVRIAAGLLVLLGVILGTWAHPGFYGLAAFVGAGLTFAGLTDWCGMALLLAKAPWNRRNRALTVGKPGKAGSTASA